ncbi:hypothetical protein THIOM_003763 [Candidatus Thiomargarita nelsonii]|uniref:Uncharacterized protein n=1 Tax=Candidatus Thiomargarita nelsonii TaxID=1003181 RepID=A0A176RXV2_9GAMM|nr:hypothetical protein THIOM_003763 [Candidatus Thiomargarita nelsonii]
MDDANHIGFSHALVQFGNGCFYSIQFLPFHRATGIYDKNIVSGRFLSRRNIG